MTLMFIRASHKVILMYTMFSKNTIVATVSYNTISTKAHLLVSLFLCLAFDSCEHNESLKCERLKFQKDRKKPDSCHPFHPEVGPTSQNNHLLVCVCVCVCVHGVERFGVSIHNNLTNISSPEMH